MIQTCSGCGAAAPEIDGPIHRYMTSSAACWRRYGELLSTLYSDPRRQQTLIICVDTYAVQHPGTNNPQAVQSVAIHLLNLYSYSVAGRAVQIPQATFSNRAFHSIASPSQRSSFWLKPPSFAGALTVFDVPVSEDSDTLWNSAKNWANSAWQAWRPHWPQVAEWYEMYSEERRV